MRIFCDIRFDPVKLLDEHGNPLSLAEMDEDTKTALAVSKIREWRTGDVAVRTYEYRFPDKRAVRETLAKDMRWFAPGKRAMTDPDRNSMGGYAVIYLQDNGRYEPGGNDE